MDRLLDDLDDENKAKVELNPTFQSGLKDEKG